MNKIKATQNNWTVRWPTWTAANYLEEAGLTPQSHALDAAGDPIENLREVLAAL